MQTRSHATARLNGLQLRQFTALEHVLVEAQGVPEFLLRLVLGPFGKASQINVLKARGDAKIEVRGIDLHMNAFIEFIANRRFRWLCHSPACIPTNST